MPRREGGFKLIVEYTESKLTLESGCEDDKSKLLFLNELHKKGALDDLIETFADMINKGIMKVRNGKVVWNSEWKIIEGVLIGYA